MERIKIFAKDIKERAECSECGWKGLSTDLTYFTWRFRQFPVCPECGSHWQKVDKNRSCIGEYYGTEEYRTGSVENAKKNDKFEVIE